MVLVKDAKVKALIDPNTKQWNHSLIEEIFKRT